MKNKSEKNVSIPSSEITPRSLYLKRRDFMKVAGLSALAAFLTACAPELPNPSPTVLPTTVAGDAVGATEAVKAVGALKTWATPMTPGKDELGDAFTPYDLITNYNNFYEFSLGKEGIGEIAKGFKPQPWSVEVGGLVHKPKTYALEDLLKKYPQQERVYRLRCVEGWSMVVPWSGFPLAQLLKEVEPMSAAKYGRFVTVMRPKEMPNQNDPTYPWPYQEGLRLDEALHDLTILATGLYGDLLPAQSGAALRLVVPWKYGFKSIKSILKIELVKEQPATLWSSIAPHEYGFYSNVNPMHAHPRWSQASERRIGEFSRRETLMFNGYAEQVADLYQNIDLAKFY